MITYIKYINVNYPARMMYVILNQKENPYSVNFAPKIPRSLKQNFEVGELPENFAKFNVNTNFIVNFWRPVLTLIILLGLSGIFKLFEIIFDKYHKGTGSYVAKRLKVLIKYNLILLIFCSNYDGIVLFSSF